MEHVFQGAPPGGEAGPRWACWEAAFFHRLCRAPPGQAAASAASLDPASCLENGTVTPAQNSYQELQTGCNVRTASEQQAHSGPRRRTVTVTGHIPEQGPGDARAASCLLWSRMEETRGLTGSAGPHPGPSRRPSTDTHGVCERPGCKASSPGARAGTCSQGLALTWKM